MFPFFHTVKQLRKSGVLDNKKSQYSRVELEHFYLCVEGCLAGLGVTAVSIYMVEKELNTHLLLPISLIVADGSSYYLLSEEPLEADNRKVIFAQWLK